MAYGAAKQSMQSKVCGVVAVCLVRGLRFLSRRDSVIRAEAADWPQGSRLKLKVPGGAGFTITGGPQGFVSLPKDSPAEVIIRFKSPADAFLVFTGQISVAQAYAQHRFVLRGNMALAMPFVRCVNRAEGYLFPAFMARRILARLPKKEVSTLRVYAAVVFGR